MKVLETNIYQRLKGHVTRPTDRFERIENGLGTGMPDVNYCILGTEGWIEIKAPTEPTRSTTPLFGSNHDVSIEQCNWFLKQYQAGGIAWLFIGTKQRLVLINGCRIAEVGRKINTLTVDNIERISVWKTSLPVKAPEIWFNLRELLSLSR